MVRSLGVVFLLVVPLWFFGQASPSDSKTIRPVDPTEALAVFAQDHHAPVPSTPKGWVVNVARYDSGTVRIGYVHGDRYDEFTAGGGPMFLETFAGKGSVTGTVDVAGTRWQRYDAVDGGATSLLRTVGDTTLLVGGVRESGPLSDLELLAATVR